MYVLSSIAVFLVTFISSYFNVKKRTGLLKTDVKDF